MHEDRAAIRMIGIRHYRAVRVFLLGLDFLNGFANRDPARGIELDC